MKKGEMDMSEAERYVSKLLQENNTAISDRSRSLFERFMSDEENLASVQVILDNQDRLMRKWKLEERIAAIVQQPVRIANATVGKPYVVEFDIEKFNWSDIIEYKFEGLEEIGLAFNSENKQIAGTPIKSGDLHFTFKFRLDNADAQTEFSERKIPLISNPDAKSLWKYIPSDSNDAHWKEDDVTVFDSFGDKHILASSKRGRSHANVGSFREDDFAYSALADGWCVVVVSDGAGSAKTSRAGSALACKSVVDYFSQKTSIEALAECNSLMEGSEDMSPDNQKKITQFLYNNLGRAAFYVHKQLEEFAKSEQLTLKDVSCTLIFALVKKYQDKYVILTFGVGDCPIAVLNKDVTKVHLMNWIDVGEFGGGTRFITMPEIFTNPKFSTRFGFRVMEDFSYLVLMSDGIYDPKFVVEANLPKLEKWHQFLNDLGGQNEEGVAVELRQDNDQIKEQFSDWMDFWSKGNHDDRTMVIVF